VDLDEDVDVPALEWKLRAAAIPAAFAIALAFHAWPTGHWLQRTFLTMIPHEFGHAITAWWCGFAAVPGLWKTMIPEARGVAVPVLVALANGALVVRGWTTQRMAIAFAGLVLGGLQFYATASIAPDTARQAITFGGDAGAMVIGTMFVLAFFVPAGSRLRRGGLRWGLLAIGAAAYLDTAATWWTARHDASAIPFGEIEGVGASDPSKLVDDHHWSVHQLVDRYMIVVALCAIAIAVVWAWGVWDARRKMGALSVPPPR
jgi:hypothetical protein